eukprot:gnl/Chilomastix_cuspidata/4696.p1 GENE.gnl/Chilomastix_cuspidata/4696~~gnl/Chilomastix_cuspidata/4696.p1  ORF type:complete len:564 (+),score=119.02 gnl/Chilomastix_cuspidata/4696:26-1717(+)
MGILFSSMRGGGATSPSTQEQSYVSLCELIAHSEAKLLIENTREVRSEQRAKISGNQALPPDEIIECFRVVARLNPMCNPTGSELFTVRRVAQYLNRQYAPYSKLSRGMPAHAFARAVCAARAHANHIQGITEIARLHLARCTRAFPPYAEAASADARVHAEIAKQTARRILALLPGVRYIVTRTRLCNASVPTHMDAHDETATRVAEEARCFSELEEEALEYVRLRACAHCFSVLAGFAAATRAPVVRYSAWAVLQTQPGIARAEKDFFAFWGARQLPFVQALLRAPLVELNGVRVSARVHDVTEIPVPARGCLCAALATDGTLCLARTLDSGVAAELELFNLFSVRRVVLSVPSLGWVCAFSDDVYVGQRDEACVRCAKIAHVFDGFPFAQFARFPLPFPVAHAATDRAAAGVLVLAPTELSQQLIHFDLAAKAARVVDCGRYIDRVGSLTGISIPGALCVATEHAPDGAQLVVFEGGRAEEISDRPFEVPHLLPSAADPADLAKAALCGSSCMFEFMGARKLFNHHGLQGNAVLVRVFQDVFLCYNICRRAWHAIRIAVP